MQCSVDQYHIDGVIEAIDRLTSPMSPPSLKEVLTAKQEKQLAAAEAKLKLWVAAHRQQ